jgi:hypothetical protein
MNTPESFIEERWPVGFVHTYREAWAKAGEVLRKTGGIPDEQHRSRLLNSL